LGTPQGHAQSAQRQLLVEAAGQVPAADRSRKDIHNNCKVDEAMPQADVGDVDGLIANDKFCLTRTARLLRKQHR
jgi:hypothetical protein